MADRIVERASDLSQLYGRNPLVQSQSWLEHDAMMMFARLEPDPDKRAAILDRQHAKGLAKYGHGLADCGLTRQQLLDHAAEEAADLLCYLIAAKEREDEQP